MADMNPINISQFMENPLDFAMTPFRVYIDPYFWVAIFGAVIAFVYVTTKSLGAVLAATLMTFGLFGKTASITDVPEFQFFFSIITVAGLAGIIFALYLKKYG